MGHICILPLPIKQILKPQYCEDLIDYYSNIICSISTVPMILFEIRKLKMCRVACLLKGWGVNIHMCLRNTSENYHENDKKEYRLSYKTR